ncbi:hypothetical protein ABIB48_000621 [Arthrobacter sp. UYCu511]
MDEQTVVVSGTGAASIVLPQLAGMLKQLRTSRTEVLKQVDSLVDAHPQHQRPDFDASGRGQEGSTHHHRGDRQGIPERRPPRLLRRAGTGDVAFRDLDPRRSPLKERQQVLKRAFFLSAFAALKDPLSRAYYDKKRAKGKRHNQALIALARRRCDVLFAMLRDGALYDAPTIKTT